jgi:hypothetical protein
VSDNRKISRQRHNEAPQTERRRRATVVHDDRGNASIEWQAAPANQERPVLEVLGENGLSLKSDEVSYDPYSNHRARKSGVGMRTDLRKLSEWIKLMRELEERKRNGGNGEE